MKNEYKIAIFTLLLVVAGCTSQSTKSEDSETNDSVADKPLVERISLESLDGKPINLDDLKGKVIFLNFWATWCKPCIKEMPSIDRARQLMKDQPVVFFVASDEDISKIKKFTSRQNYTFQFAHSVSSVFDLDLKALPTTMIINPEGKIVFNEMGGRDWATDENLKFIKSFEK